MSIRRALFEPEGRVLPGANQGGRSVGERNPIPKQSTMLRLPTKHPRQLVTKIYDNPFFASIKACPSLHVNLL